MPGIGGMDQPAAVGPGVERPIEQRRRGDRSQGGEEPARPRRASPPASLPVSSRRISSPRMRKKIASSPSAHQFAMLSDSRSAGGPTAEPRADETSIKGCQGAVRPEHRPSPRRQEDEARGGRKVRECPSRALHPGTHRLLERFEHRMEVPGAVIAHAIDEDGGIPVTPFRRPSARSSSTRCLSTVSCRSLVKRSMSRPSEAAIPSRALSSIGGSRP